jgi:hypothetical protein
MYRAHACHLSWITDRRCSRLVPQDLQANEAHEANEANEANICFIASFASFASFASCHLLNGDIQSYLRLPPFVPTITKTGSYVY